MTDSIDPAAVVLLVGLVFWLCWSLVRSAGE